MGPIERTTSFTFGEWTVEPELHQLRLGDEKVSIEPKVMSVLLELAARPQRVVSKEHLLQAVWTDTNVGDDALTRCISLLRQALRDDAHNPQFIKTIPKAGYCLLVQVQRPTDDLEQPDSISTFAQVVPEPATEPLPVFPSRSKQDEDTAGKSLIGDSPLQGRDPKTGAVNKWITFGLLAVLVGGVVVAIIFAKVRDYRAVPQISGMWQLTREAGQQSHPAVSADGKLIAFVWARQSGGNRQIYITDLRGAAPARLSDLLGDEDDPVWSPNGSHIAFLAAEPTGLALYESAVRDPHSTRKIYIPSERSHWEVGALAWSADGKSLFLADHLGNDPRSTIMKIDTQSLVAENVTHPLAGWEGDLSPSVSPDGNKLAFLRASENALTDIFWIPIGGGEPRRVTFDGKPISGITWSSDSKSLIFSSNRGGDYSLWNVDLDGRAPRLMPVGTENSTQPSLAAGGEALAFVQGTATFGIRKVDVENPLASSKDGLILASTAGDSAPSVSPDGGYFAFQSTRAGTQDVWVSSMDGQSLRRLTPSDRSFSGSGSPSWSPSSNQILFDSRVQGHSHIFAVSSDGSNTTQLTFGQANDIVPRWSADGKKVYFRSNRGGRWQLWRLDLSRKTPEPITKDDGIAAQESADGKWIYFARGGEGGLWRVAADGGEPIRILDQPAAGYWAYWTLTPNGLYFLSKGTNGFDLSRFDSTTGIVSNTVHLDHPPPLYAGLSALPGAHQLLMSDMRDAGSHITVALGTF